MAIALERGLVVSALRFDVQWLDGSGMEGPELAATVASLRILVADSVWTQVVDRRAKPLRDCIYVPL